MHSQRGIDQYQQVNVQTVTPERMIVLLYDGIVRFLGCAKNAIEIGDVAAKNRNLAKAQAIVQELAGALDHKVGASFTANLAGLYNYVNREIMEAFIDGKPHHIADVLHTLTPLVAAWEELAQKGSGQAPLTEISNIGMAGTSSADFGKGDQDSGTDSSSRSSFSLAT